MVSWLDVFETILKVFVYGCGLVLLSMVGISLYWAFVFPFTKAGQKAKAAREELRKQIEASRRIELVGGRYWEVVTKPHTLLRNRKTGQHAAILSRGGQNDPSIDNQGALALRPRWVKVQPLMKGLIPSKSARRWTQLQGWDAVGVVQLHWKDRPASGKSEKASNNA